MITTAQSPGSSFPVSYLIYLLPEKLQCCNIIIYRILFILFLACKLRKKIKNKKMKKQTVPRKVAPSPAKNWFEDMLPEKMPPRKPLKKYMCWKIHKFQKCRLYCCSFICYCLRDFWGNKKCRNVNCKSGLTEKYFFATIFQSKIWEKTRCFDTISFPGFSKHLEDKTIRWSLVGSQ